MAPASIDTAFTRVVGCRLPIMQAPMGGAAGPRLVSAAAAAGALGMLPIWVAPVQAAAQLIDATKAQTSAPIAVNLRADLAMHDHIAAAVDRGVNLIHLFWGDPAPSAATARRLGARIMVTVSDADTTKAALDAGAVALLAQGVEAGGHVLGTTPLADLIPLAVELGGDVPVVALGGLATADDAVRAFELGASAAGFGTRFVACEEADAHADYKGRIVRAQAGDTVRTLCFDGFWPDAPHRVLKNSTFRAWAAAGEPGHSARPGEGEAIMQAAAGGAIPRYHVSLPLIGMTGDLEAAALYAGEGVGRISHITTAAAFIEQVAERIAAHLGA